MNILSLLCRGDGDARNGRGFLSQTERNKRSKVKKREKTQNHKTVS